MKNKKDYPFKTWRKKNFATVEAFVHEARGRGKTLHANTVWKWENKGVIPCPTTTQQDLRARFPGIKF